MPPTIEEMAQDPVMGRAIREFGRPLAEQATGQTPPANGNDSYSGPPTSGVRARDITQDRPSDLVPSFSLPGRATDPPLGWHRQVADLAAGATGKDGTAHEPAVRSVADLAVPTPFPIHPSLAHLHPQVGMVLTPVVDHAEQVANARRGEPTPTVPPPLPEAQAAKPTGMAAAVATPEFAKIRATVAEVFNEARESAGHTRQAGQDNQPQQHRGREGHGR